MRRKEAIIRFLAKIGRADYIQIATYIGASLTTTSTQLTNLKRSGLVQNIKWRDGSRLWVLTQFVFLLGLGIVTASWVLLLLFIVFVIGCVVFANVEEQGCLQKYGDSYREYMNRTPRWIGIPKS